MSRLPPAFIARPVLEVAADLLDRHVERGGVTVRLTETEAYAGHSDPASRVLRRPTRHNAPVFGPPGHAFVYFTYGHHWMLCVVTREDVPEVVLLRDGEVVAGLPVALVDRRRPDRVDLWPGRGAARR